MWEVNSKLPEGAHLAPPPATDLITRLEQDGRREAGLTRDEALLLQGLIHYSPDLKNRLWSNCTAVSEQQGADANYSWAGERKGSGTRGVNNKRETLARQQLTEAEKKKKKMQRGARRRHLSGHSVVMCRCGSLRFGRRVATANKKLKKVANIPEHLKQLQDLWGLGSFCPFKVINIILFIGNWYLWYIKLKQHKYRHLLKISQRSVSQFFFTFFRKHKKTEPNLEHKVIIFHFIQQCCDYRFSREKIMMYTMILSRWLYSYTQSRETDLSTCLHIRFTNMIYRFFYTL